MKKTSRFYLLVRTGLAGLAMAGLSACQTGLELPFGQSVEPAAPTRASATPASATGIEVEAPDVFFLEETGLWDGRPSLGGVWVAHPDVNEPERVLITNMENGQTVTGALFRRERENHGPAIMISSDAAAAINVIAGQPTELSVVALRRQELPAEIEIPVAPPEPVAEGETDGETALPGAIATTTLDQASAEISAGPIDVEALASEAIETSGALLNPDDIAAETAALALAMPDDLVSDATPAPDAPRAIDVAVAAPAAAAPTATAPTPVAAPTPSQPSNLDRPFIQIGLYAVEGNALNAADHMRSGGMVPTILDQSNADRALWRVIVGPAQNAAERTALLETIRGLGYQDAYFVAD